MICSLFLLSIIELNLAEAVHLTECCFVYLSNERMPEWIFLAMPFEHNKVKGMSGRTHSFQGWNNKVMNATASSEHCNSLQ